MSIAKDDVIAALRIRYDYYSAETVFDLARARANLPESASFDASQLAAFRAALANVGDRIEQVDARLATLSPSPSTPAPAPAPAPKAEMKPEPKPDKGDAKPAKKKDAKPEAATPVAPSTGTVIALTGVELADGDQLFVCGGSPELGDWDPARARALAKTGDHWSPTVTVSPDADVAYKFLRKTADGSFVWEGGENRALVAQPRIDATWR